MIWEGFAELGEEGISRSTRQKSRLTCGPWRTATRRGTVVCASDGSLGAAKMLLRAPSLCGIGFVRDYVLPDDVQHLAVAPLGHRGQFPPRFGSPRSTRPANHWDSDCPADGSSLEGLMAFQAYHSLRPLKLDTFKSKKTSSIPKEIFELLDFLSRRC